MVAPHAFSSAILLVAAMHLLASIPNGLVLEFDQNPHALREDLLQEPIRIDADGFVHLPGNQGWVSHSIKRRWNSIVCKVVITVRRGMPTTVGIVGLGNAGSAMATACRVTCHWWALMPILSAVTLLPIWRSPG